MQQDTIIIRQAYRETGLSPDVLKKLTADLPILGRKNGGDLYDRKDLYKKIAEYKAVPNEPPPGCDHLANIAKMLGMHKETLYALERKGDIKPLGFLRALCNGRIVKFYNIDYIASLFKKKDDKNAIYKKPPDFVSYGQLAPQTISQLKTLTHSFNVAHAR